MMISTCAHRYTCIFFFLMIQRPPRSNPIKSSAASDVYKRQIYLRVAGKTVDLVLSEKKLGDKMKYASRVAKAAVWSATDAEARKHG